MRILVIGGYGTFGKRLVDSLVNYHEHQVIIAGRSAKKLSKAKHLLSISSEKTIETLQLDVLTDDLENKLAAITPNIVVNAVGPYQLQKGDQSYRVARACIEQGCHYTDLADDQEFVNQFSDELHQKARDAGVILVTGASTVPALTDAVIRYYMPQFNRLESVNYGISLGNQTERGAGTLDSILSYAGKPFSTLLDGKWLLVYGWQNLARYDFGEPVGKRWMSNCDIPDLQLLPLAYPQINSIRFQAGLELSVLHLGLWFLSWLARLSVIKNLTNYSKKLIEVSKWFYHWGSDIGGMFVELIGKGQSGEIKKLKWQLVAERGTGPNVPTIAAEILINKIEQGKLRAGAKPCLDMFTLEEFLIVASRWDIYQKEMNND